VNRDIEATKLHLETVKQALGKDIEGTIDLLFGGSVAKHTYVDGMSDIDSLVILNKTELKDLSPQEVRKYLSACLKERLPNTEIQKGDLAVTVKFKDIEIQLLPAIKYKSGFRIPDASGKDWSFIKPKEFTDILAKVNADNGYKLIPTIKLAKSIVSGLPDNRRLTGYHIEALAVETFQQYSGPRTPKDMLRHFFLEAQRLVMSPVKDRTGQSIHVDDYLGAKNSLERKMVADSLGRIGRRMLNADGAQLVNEWRDVLSVV